jgi:hypothetical protein
MLLIHCVRMRWLIGLDKVGECVSVSGDSFAMIMVVRLD